MERNPKVWRKLESNNNPNVIIYYDGKSTLKRFGFNVPSSGL